LKRFSVVLAQKLPAFTQFWSWVISTFYGKIMAYFVGAGLFAASYLFLSAQHKKSKKLRDSFDA